jgi:uncharacterized integral membrane protein
MVGRPRLPMPPRPHTLGAMADPTQVRHHPTEEGGSGWRRWGLWVVLAILVLFIALNSQQVKVNLIVGTAEMPLIFALLIAAALGALVGWAAPRLRSHRRGD